MRARAPPHESYQHVNDLSARRELPVLLTYYSTSDINACMIVTPKQRRGVFIHLHRSPDRRGVQLDGDRANALPSSAGDIAASPSATSINPIYMYSARRSLKDPRSVLFFFRFALRCEFLPPPSARRNSVNKLLGTRVFE